MTQEIFVLFQRLWTKAVGTDGYDHGEWRELSLMISKLDTRAALAESKEELPDFESLLHEVYELMGGDSESLEKTQPNWFTPVALDLLHSLPPWALENKTLLKGWLQRMVEFPSNASLITLDVVKAAWEVQGMMDANRNKK